LDGHQTIDGGKFRDRGSLAIDKTEVDARGLRGFGLSAVVMTNIFAQSCLINSSGDGIIGPPTTILP
jgi:hypothetical protein